MEKSDSNVKLELVTDYGHIVLQLYNKTPVHYYNFIKIISDGVLDNLLF